LLRSHISNISALNAHVRGWSSSRNRVRLHHEGSNVSSGNTCHHNDTLGCTCCTLEYIVVDVIANLIVHSASRHPKRLERFLQFRVLLLRIWQDSFLLVADFAFNYLQLLFMSFQLSPFRKLFRLLCQKNENFTSMAVRFFGCQPQPI
jgi:hypothetical protein